MPTKCIFNKRLTMIIHKSNEPTDSYLISIIMLLFADVSGVPITNSEGIYIKQINI